MPRARIKTLRGQGLHSRLRRISRVEVMHVPYLDLSKRAQELSRPAEAAVSRVLASGNYVAGHEVSEFERRFADYVGSTCCVGVGNGLEALKLILLALDVGPGQEVIVPAQTFIATWFAISETGATVRPVDIQNDTGNICPQAVLAAIGPRTVGVIAVHLHGLPADMDELKQLCDAKGLFLVEDAAQAHGASAPWGQVGSAATAAAFSFYPTKNLGGVGDGGAVTTNDAQLARRIRQLGNYGGALADRTSFGRSAGNSRLDPIQAAFLNVSLVHLDSWNRKRREIAAQYDSAIMTQSSFTPLLRESRRSLSVWHHYVVCCEERDGLQAALGRHGVGTQVHYATTPMEYRYFREAMGLDPEEFPNAYRHSRTVLSLPLHPWLGDQADFVKAALMRIDR